MSTECPASCAKSISTSVSASVSCTIGFQVPRLPLAPASPSAQPTSQSTSDGPAQQHLDCQTTQTAQDNTALERIQAQLIPPHVGIPPSPNTFLNSPAPAPVPAHLELEVSVWSLRHNLDLHSATLPYLYCPHRRLAPFRPHCRYSRFDRRRLLVANTYPWRQKRLTSRFLTCIRGAA